MEARSSELEVITIKISAQSNFHLPASNFQTKQPIIFIIPKYNSYYFYYTIHQPNFAS